MTMRLIYISIVLCCIVVSSTTQIDITNDNANLNDNSNNNNIIYEYCSNQCGEFNDNDNDNNTDVTVPPITGDVCSSFYQNNSFSDSKCSNSNHIPNSVFYDTRYYLYAINDENQCKQNQRRIGLHCMKYDKPFLGTNKLTILSNELSCETSIIKFIGLDKKTTLESNIKFTNTRINYQGLEDESEDKQMTLDNSLEYFGWTSKTDKRESLARVGKQQSFSFQPEKSDSIIREGDLFKIAFSDKNGVNQWIWCPTNEKAEICIPTTNENKATSFSLFPYPSNKITCEA